MRLSKLMPGLLSEFIPIVANNSQFLEKGLGYAGITVMIIVIWMLLRYEPK